MGRAIGFFLLIIFFLSTKTVREIVGSEATHPLTGLQCATAAGVQGVCEAGVSCQISSQISVGSPSSACQQVLQKRTLEFPTQPLPTVCCITDLLSRDLEHVCGTSAVPNLRIVGGMPAHLNAWPWMAAIFPDAGGPTTTCDLCCGGALISDSYVLTAAHCLTLPKTETLRPVNTFRIRFGDLHLNSDSDGATPVEVEAAELIRHPQYNDKTVKYDIGLIRLAKKMNFTKAVLPICLPTNEMVNESMVGQRPHIAGWGTAVEGERGMSALHQVQLEVISNADCAEIFRPRKWTISQHQLCAGSAFHTKDSGACVGDSGGPLMTRRSHKWYIIGVISVGYRCGKPGYPEILSRVTEFLSWIKTNAKLE